MAKFVSDFEVLKQLRQIPAFVEFSQREMTADAGFWAGEARHGEGIMQAAAAAIVEIGGDAE